MPVPESLRGGRARPATRLPLILILVAASWGGGGAVGQHGGASWRPEGRRLLAADAAVRALLVDSADWLAPRLPMLHLGSRPPTGRRALNGTWDTVHWIDGVVEGVADTVIDDNATHTTMHTIVHLKGSGDVVEVDLGAFGGPGVAKPMGRAVKWAVQRVPPRGSLGLLTRGSVEEAVEG